MPNPPPDQSKTPHSGPRTVTVVMYHYVRKLTQSRYPGIKGLETLAFEQQVRWIRRHFTPVGAEEVMEAVNTGGELPPRAILLTFDDGYTDHFTDVFPILDEQGIRGAFFPPASCVRGEKVLDVNKLHFILASVENPALLVKDLLERVGDAGSVPGLLSPDAYWERVDKTSRWDTPDITFVKRMLQRELPASFRNGVVDEWFREHVSDNEQAFARELYMSPGQVRCLHRHGHTIGHHGVEHIWLNHADEKQRKAEIEGGLSFMQDLGVDTRSWWMNYPYGGHDEALHRLVAGYGCGAGLSTRVDRADLDRDPKYALPRINTNDLPTLADAPPNMWVPNT